MCLWPPDLWSGRRDIQLQFCFYIFHLEAHFTLEESWFHGEIDLNILWNKLLPFRKLVIGRVENHPLYFILGVYTWHIVRDPVLIVDSLLSSVSICFSFSDYRTTPEWFNFSSNPDWCSHWELSQETAFHTLSVICTQPACNTGKVSTIQERSARKVFKCKLSR